MPLRLPDKLPAIELLKKENIFVMNDSRATSQDIRPLRIAFDDITALLLNRFHMNTSFTTKYGNRRG